MSNTDPPADPPTTLPVGVRSGGSARPSLAVSAIWVLVLNTAANLLLLAGNAYAARSLGPVGLGVSGQVLAAVQQAGLVFNGGLDPVAVRAIAAGHEAPTAVLRAVLSFRCVIAVLLSLAWIAVVLTSHPPGPVRSAWLLGVPLLLCAALQLSFFFQAVEQMPRFAAVSAASALVIAGTYAATFHPAMPVGSDLLVLGTVGMLTAGGAAWLSFRLAGIRVASFFDAWRSNAAPVRQLLLQSWRYWLLAVLVFVYTLLPLLLIGRAHGDAAAGILRICLVLAGGLELIFSSINSLLLPRLVQWHSAGREILRSRQRQLLKVHMATAAGVALVTVAAAPLVFQRFLGPEFASALMPFMLFAASRIVVFFGQIYAWGLVAMRLDGPMLYATACGAATSLSLNILLIPQFSVVGTGVAALTAETVVASLAFIFQRRHL